jgi:phage terminase large subunit-like protein
LPRGANARAATDELEAFDAFCRAYLVIENGGSLLLEDWQREVLIDHFDGAVEEVVLLPKGQGKTTLFAALSLWSLLTTSDARIYLAAASRDQASLMYQHALGFVDRQPKLQELIATRPGYRELRNRSDSGFLRTVSADSNTNDGTGATLVCVDEYHRHKTTDLVAVFRDGLGKRGGKMVTISTAGANSRTPLGQVRERAHLLKDQSRDDFHFRAVSPDGSFRYHEWAVPDGEDVDSIEVVKRANPSSFVTVEELRRRYESPSMHRREWLRYAANQWVGALEDAWLEPGRWSALADPEMVIPDGAEVYLGVDIGLRHDTSAVAIVHQLPDGRYAVEGTVFEPPAEGDLDLSKVEQHIMSLADRYAVQSLTYDRWGFARSAQYLSDMGLLCLDMPMTNERTVPACARLLEAVNRAELVHNGDPVLTAHVEAGAIRETERGWRISKGKTAQQGGKIDLLMAMLLAHTTASASNPTINIEWI